MGAKPQATPTADPVDEPAGDCKSSLSEMLETKHESKLDLPSLLWASHQDCSLTGYKLAGTYRRLPTSLKRPCGPGIRSCLLYQGG